MSSIYNLLSADKYPGRGIAVCASACGRYAYYLYFIMGRSKNSRNRIFEEQGEGIRTKAFDESAVADPSLIIYAPVMAKGALTVITNGAQTNTVFDFVTTGGSFYDSLYEWCYEPDEPNFTPRISALADTSGGYLSCKMSILKKSPFSDSCDRLFYSYSQIAPGRGYFIHTYAGDGDPLPSFCGEPESFKVTDSFEEFTKKAWDSLDAENKISLFARRVDLSGGEYKTVIINKN